MSQLLQFLILNSQFLIPNSLLRASVPFCLCGDLPWQSSVVIFLWLIFLLTSDDADALDAGALRRVDDRDDLPVAEAAGAHDEHCLVQPACEDVPEPPFQLLQCHVVLVDCDVAIGSV